MFHHYLIKVGLMTGNINLAHKDQYAKYTEVIIRLSNLIQMVKWVTFYHQPFSMGLIELSYSPASMAQQFSVHPGTKRSPVQVLVRVHAPVMGYISRRGKHAGGSQSVMFLLHRCFSLFLSILLSKIQQKH